MDKDTYRQRCPLCSNPAEYRLVDKKKHKTFLLHKMQSVQDFGAAEKCLEQLIYKTRHRSFRFFGSWNRIPRQNLIKVLNRCAAGGEKKMHMPSSSGARAL